MANFEGGDTGVGNYLQEIIGLTQISSDSAAITNAIDNLITSTSIFVRDVGAALRDTIEKIKSYKDEDGSILYFITYTGSDLNTITWELDIADSLINNRIQLVAVEAGAETDNLKKSLERVSALTNGFYYYTERFGTDEFFTPVNEQILKTVEDPIETGRRSVCSFLTFLFTRRVTLKFPCSCSTEKKTLVLPMYRVLLRSTPHQI